VAALQEKIGRRAVPEGLQLGLTGLIAEGGSNPRPQSVSDSTAAGIRQRREETPYPFRIHRGRQPHADNRGNFSKQCQLLLPLLMYLRQAEHVLLTTDNHPDGTVIKGGRVGQVRRFLVDQGRH
jgi:hypothetical protein